MDKFKRIVRNRGILCLFVTLGIITVLIVASSPAQALSITVTNPPSGYLGYPYTFEVKIDVENSDLLPIRSVDLQIFNVGSPSTYRADCTNLPLPTGASSTATRTYSGSYGTIDVSGTSGANWGYGIDDRYGYGYGYQSGTWGTYPLGYGYGYGYGYGSYVGPASITYTVTWTPPAGWPTGEYNIKVLVYGNGSITFTHPEIISLTLSSIPSGGPGGPPPPTTEPGTTDVSDFVNSDGVFTQDVTATSADGKVELFIPEGTVGLTEDGEPLSEIIIVPTDAPTGASTINVLGQIYDIGPDGATFDPPVTLTIHFDPDEVPEGEVPVIHHWDPDANDGEGAWVECPGCVVDMDSGTITVEISHLTPFAVLTVEAPTPPTTTPPTTTPPTTTPPTTTPPTTTPPTTTPPTTTPPTTTTPTITPTDDGGTNLWVILGPVIGAVVILLLLGYFLIFKRRWSD